METNKKSVIALRCSILSGVFASLAAVFGKFATSPQICHSYVLLLIGWIFNFSNNSFEIQVSDNNYHHHHN